jgi:hypothetical protein
MTHRALGSGPRSRALAAIVFTTVALLEGRVETAQGQDQSARLRVAETLRVSGTTATLTFVSVQRDSRCPKGARCIRAGEAVVVLSVREGNGDATTLTFEVPPGGGASQSFHGYRIQIVGLDPQTETDVEIAPSDYVATVAVRQP